jgi:hypothetical protein
MGEPGERGRDVLSQLISFFTSTYGIITILGFVVLIVIIFNISRSNFINSLTDKETARGLITFLVVFTTVAIALILALYTLLSSITVREDLKDRFGYGKEVLTALIGILGTILGFYFASSTQESPRDATRAVVSNTQTPQVSSAFISNDNPKKGDIVQIYSFVSGGKTPYTYSILFSPPSIISPIADRVSLDGGIKEEIKIPESVQENTELTFRITVKDSNGKSAIYDDRTKKFLVKTQ